MHSRRRSSCLVVYTRQTGAGRTIVEAVVIQQSRLSVATSLRRTDSVPRQPPSFRPYASTFPLSLEDENGVQQPRRLQSLPLAGDGLVGEGRHQCVRGLRATIDGRYLSGTEHAGDGAPQSQAPDAACSEPQSGATKPRHSRASKSDAHAENTSHSELKDTGTLTGPPVARPLEGLP